MRTLSNTCRFKCAQVGCLFLFVATLYTSGHTSISAPSARLDSLRIVLEKKPTLSTERAYLEAFPKTFPQFHETFYGHGCIENPECKLGELYYVSYEHVLLLEKLSERHPDQVLSIWFGIASEGKWDSDAVSILQSQIAGYGAKNTVRFVKTLQTFPRAKRDEIVRFIVDAESHGDYKEYQDLINSLARGGFPLTRRDFIAAAERRARIHNH